MKLFGVLVVILILVIAGALFFKPRQSLTSDTVSPAPTNTDSIQTVAENLSIPWEIEFLPDGSLLVTERPGRLLHIMGDQKKSIEVAGVQHRGEGGLLGLALHPDFEQNHFVYLYLTAVNGSSLINRVERYQFDAEQNELSDKRTIIENIPGANNHDGGRIAFGPDKLLYITTGDAQQEKLAQDTSSLAGKILRIRDDGTIPSDNPFNTAVYSYGHRNPQGLAWDGQGRLWATEHGPSGTQTGHDEVNLIEKGQNYGWPTIKGDQKRENMRAPAIHSGSADTWAPGGTTIIGETLYFVGLRGEALYSAHITSDSLENLTPHLSGEYGRLRAVRQGPDGWLYIATSNTDGRGVPRTADDRIIKLNPALLQ